MPKGFRFSLSNPRLLTKVVGFWTFGYWMGTNVYSLFSVSGRSMQPTLNPDSNKLRSDWLLVNRLTTWDLASNFNQHFGWNRGDVVVMKHPFKSENFFLVKRIVALPNDIIEVQIPILDSQGKESHEKRRFKISEGHCWVEGDGEKTKDSRNWGELPLALIVGKATKIVKPLNRWGPLDKAPQWTEGSGKAKLIEAFDINASNFQDIGETKV